MFSWKPGPDMRALQALVVGALAPWGCLTESSEAFRVLCMLSQMHIKTGVTVPRISFSQHEKALTNSAESGQGAVPL